MSWTFLCNASYLYFLLPPCHPRQCGHLLLERLVHSSANYPQLLLSRHLVSDSRYAALASSMQPWDAPTILSEHGHSK
ncbi:hypothetical protein F4604DRAFT_1715185 [Suillus subluteus]|nr:hypothetical protein F4604DRAFT_1715185 [Suillus subluteus]